MSFCIFGFDLGFFNFSKNLSPGSVSRHVLVLMEISREHCAWPIQEQHAHLPVSKSCSYLSLLRVWGMKMVLWEACWALTSVLVCSWRVSWCDFQLPCLSVMIGSLRNVSDSYQLNIIELEMCSQGCQTRNICQLLVKHEQNDEPEVKPAKPWFRLFHAPEK